LLPLIGISQTNAQLELPISGSTVSEKQPLEIKRNALYNLEEIKVRWKKAALENCPGAPCVTAPSFLCGTSTVPDNEGNTYNTVLIGTQCWTKENLRVTMYNDGTAIPIDATGGPGGTSIAWQNLTTGAYTIYGNGPSTGTVATNYGFLYNWYAAVGIVTPMGSPTKNICPTGWHVPTDGQWIDLETQLGGNSVAGGKMKSTSSLWTSPNTGADNTSGFTALPGGYRDNGGSFTNGSSSAFFWSATEYGSSFALYPYLASSNSTVYSGYDRKSIGASVRCLRD
jgi:uncharacterized protein (TIGR02145 family)